MFLGEKVVYGVRGVRIGNDIFVCVWIEGMVGGS